MIRTTYALDEASVRKLEGMARRWGVSKSEALRRAIRIAAGEEPPEGRKKLDALARLQLSLRVRPGQLKSWTMQVRRERHQASRRREKQNG